MAQPVVANPLEPLCEGWQRGLAIVAHPDDLEFGAAAAIARWTGQGKQIIYCLVTSGEAGIDAMAPAQARLVREAEHSRRLPWSAWRWWSSWASRMASSSTVYHCGARWRGSCAVTGRRS